MRRTVYYDSGTSNSRLFLLDGAGEPVYAAKKHVGSRDSAITGSNTVLINGLYELYSEMLEKCNLQDSDIENIYASGMITSPFGMHEVPHLELPLTLEHYAESLVPFCETAKFNRDIILIPGAKTMNRDFAFVNNTRGEEIEAVGVLADLGATLDARPVAVVFPGSHTHAVLLRDQSLAGLLCHFTGELFEALRKETILAPILNVKLESYDMDMVKMAIANLAIYGFNRALYIGHAMQIFREYRPEQRKSYIEGVLAGGVGQSLAHYFHNQWFGCSAVAIVADGMIGDLYQTILEETDCAQTILRLHPDKDKSYGLKGMWRLLQLRQKG